MIRWSMKYMFNALSWILGENVALVNFNLFPKRDMFTSYQNTYLIGSVQYFNFSPTTLVCTSHEAALKDFNCFIYQSL